MRGLGMRGLGRWLSAVALVLGTTGIGVALSAAPACACSCVPPDPEQYAASAEAIFTGVVRGVEQRGGPLTSTAAATVVTTIDVDGVHKGDVAQQVEVATADGEASCGIEFRVGERYRVYADTAGGQLSGTRAPYHASLCGGTVRLNGEPNGVGVTKTAALGPARTPRPGQQLAPPHNLDWAFGAGLAVVAGLLLLPAMLALRSRRPA